MDSISQPEFDQLATFVAVADELRKEPFFSEDNRERLMPVMGSPTAVLAHFCHPAFLKSAILPFRKLWLYQSEPCAFETVRELVFKYHPDKATLAAHQTWFYERYMKQLDEPAAPEWSNESTRKFLNIWLYTQAVHAGKKRFPSGKTLGEFDLNDFDQWAQQIGREKFEFLFRISLRIVGHFYIQFLDKLAEPWFWTLRRAGMIPGFEAGAALKYSPYPDPRHGITFDDVFWHLDKESMEETFNRLLDRNSYSAVKGILRACFPGSRPEALAAICDASDFAAFLERNAVRVLGDSETVEDLSLRAAGDSAFSPIGAVSFEVYEGRKIRFKHGAENNFAQIYEDFRKCLFEERKRQRPQQWECW